jgi:pectinesterase
VDGDRVVVRDARVLGWHDTLFLNRGRQYFENTYIAGHMDFIFGAATTFFSRCHLHVRRDGCITAASTPSESRYGFVFDECRITGEAPETRAYLGRPWRDFARVAFLRTEMAAVIRPEGWHNSDRPAREKTARFEEFANSGPGATPEARAPWTTSITAKEVRDCLVQMNSLCSNEHSLFK